VYLLYGIKVLLYVGGWLLFCSFTPGMGGLGSIASWWLEPIAFQKAILWNMLFEGLGLGCGSGPLTGRFYPPIGGFLYFLRPGTVTPPRLPGLPILGGSRRTWLETVLYAAWMAVLLAALVSPQPSRAQLAAAAALVVVLGITDKTTFLAVRAEHFWTTVMVFVLADN